MSTQTIKVFHETGFGRMVLGDAVNVFAERLGDKSVDLIVTSPPFGLVRKKDYGNVDAPLTIWIGFALLPSSSRGCFGKAVVW